MPLIWRLPRIYSVPPGVTGGHGKPFSMHKNHVVRLKKNKLCSAGFNICDPPLKRDVLE